MKTSSTERPPFPRPGDVLETQDGRRLRLTEVIGRGGQGAVFRTDDPRRAVKLRYLFDTDGTWRRRIERLRTLLAEHPAMPRFDSFALPGALLVEPWVGYDMPLLERAVPLSKIIELPVLDASGGSEAECPEEWYRSTGGLRRRLRIGVRLARAMRLLHGAGLVFGDLSSSNVLIADDAVNPTVRLIDCDNICAGAAGEHVVGTPGYWAPELFLGTVRPDAATDDHSLAVLLHELVFLAHPLRGDRLATLPPEEGEARIDRGEVEWVHAPAGGNPTSAGLRPELALPNSRAQLFDLFATAFGRGLRDRALRPSSAAFQSALEQAEAMTFSCHSCQSTAIYDRQVECSWCGAAIDPPFLLLIGPDPSLPWMSELKRAREVVTSLRSSETIAQEITAPRAHDRTRVVEGVVYVTEAMVAPSRCCGGAEGETLGRIEQKDGLVGVEAFQSEVFALDGVPLRGKERALFRTGQKLRLLARTGEAGWVAELVKPRRRVTP